MGLDWGGTVNRKRNKTGGKKKKKKKIANIIDYDLHFEVHSSSCESL